MVRVVGVRFKLAGKVYYFDPADLPVAVGDKVIVETVRGVEYGEVVVGPKDVPEEEVVQPLKKVIRLGTERDAQIAAENKRKEKEAFAIALSKIETHGLDMFLVDVEYTFDGSKIIFYFTAEGRIDFRELVRDLASVFRTRIEMRQIGVRDEAKILGGIGPCGRILCCTSFLGDFAPVSIRMAKDQNLSLNPSKISGLCGRLMCCLRYEQETYEAAKKDPTLAPSYVPPAALFPPEPVVLELEDEGISVVDDAFEHVEADYDARIAEAALEPEPAPGRRDRNVPGGEHEPRREGEGHEGQPAAEEEPRRKKSKKKSRSKGQAKGQAAGQSQGHPKGQGKEPSRTDERYDTGQEAELPAGDHAQQAEGAPEKKGRRDRRRPRRKPSGDQRQPRAAQREGEAKQVAPVPEQAAAKPAKRRRRRRGPRGGGGGSPPPAPGPTE